MQSSTASFESCSVAVGALLTSLPRLAVPCRAHRGVADSATAEEEASTSSSLFDRHVEFAALEELVSDAPSSITLVLGPRDSGKTKLMTTFAQRYRLDGVCYIDCRGFRASHPTDFARALGTKGLPALVTGLPDPGKHWVILKQIAQVMSMFTVEWVVGKDGPRLSANAGKGLDEYQKDKDKAVPSIESIINIYTQLLSRWREAASKDGKRLLRPVIVLDEANKLMNWGAEYNTDLDALLEFFKKITKQDQAAHVVLVTSEYAFQGWLTDRECCKCVTCGVSALHNACSKLQAPELS
jgi:AAA+ ATPase superfamily predicted ATPase